MHLYKSKFNESQRRAAGLFVKSADGYYLLGRRALHLHYYPDLWAVFGGGVKGQESFQDAAVREFKEETGYKGKIKNIEFLYKNESTDGFVFKTFSAEIDEKFTPVLTQEHSDAKWFRLEDIPMNIHPGMREMLNELGYKTQEVLKECKDGVCKCGGKCDKCKDKIEEVAVRSIVDFKDKHFNVHDFNYSDPDYEILYDLEIDNEPYAVAVVLAKVEAPYQRYRLAIHFGAEHINKTELTNKNTPFKILSHVIGCVEDFIKSYESKRNWPESVNITEILISSKSEYKGDKRRLLLYNQFFNFMSKKYGVKVTSQKGIKLSEDEPGILYTIEPFTIPVGMELYQSVFKEFTVADFKDQFGNVQKKSYPARKAIKGAFERGTQLVNFDINTGTATFLCEPTHSFHAKTLDPSGGVHEENVYKVEMEFEKWQEWVDDWKTMSLTDWQEVLKVCDIKLNCDCFSYNFQGIRYSLSQVDSAIHPTNIPDPIWGPRQGNNLGPIICKHMQAVIAKTLRYPQQIYNDIKRKAK